MTLCFFVWSLFFFFTLYLHLHFVRREQCYQVPHFAARCMRVQLFTHSMFFVCSLVVFCFRFSHNVCYAARRFLALSPSFFNVFYKVSRSIPLTKMSTLVLCEQRVRHIPFVHKRKKKSYEKNTNNTRMQSSRSSCHWNSSCASLPFLNTRLWLVNVVALNREAEGGLITLQNGSVPCMQVVKSVFSFQLHTFTLEHFLHLCSHCPGQAHMEEQVALQSYSSRGNALQNLGSRTIAWTLILAFLLLKHQKRHLVRTGIYGIYSCDGPTRVMAAPRTV